MFAVREQGSRAPEQLNSASVQFWMNEAPNFLPDSRNRRASGSIHDVPRTPESLRETMAIFRLERRFYNFTVNHIFLLSGSR